MKRTLRWTVRLLPVLTSLIAILASGPAGAGPIERTHRPVGWNRIVRPKLPAPVKAANGGVYVPQELKRFPTLEIDSHVADDDSQDMFGGRALQGPAPGFRSARPDQIQSVSANVRTNNTAGDPAGSTQSETTIAALGNNLVSGWNDGKNFSISPGGTGYASSSNGGLSWTDGGVLPVPSSTALHEGDPVLTNDYAGNFYFSDLYTPDNDVTSAIAVCKGTFSGGVVVWNMPVMVASTTTDFLDKEWIAADKVGGNVYCTYTRFLAAGGDQIEFSRSLDNGATWSLPFALTSPTVESVQGSRVVVGPSGEIEVIYFVYDVASGNNYMRARRSTTQGTSWGPEITLPTGPSGILSGYGSGPAGFNRAGGIGFPSLAVDITGGANNGRLYATWEETVNFYYDPLGTLGGVAEVEGNDTPGTANAITIGQAVSGAMASTADQDWFSFTGTAGQTVIVYLTPGTGDGFLRLYAGGGGTANRTQLSYIGFGTGLCVYTLPYTGTYYFRVLANSATIGTYTVYTGLDAPDPGDEVGRDTRDAIVQTSPDGVVWSPRAVVNDDQPRFDNAFPEVAVDAAGQVFIYWMDHRGDPLGIGTDYYYSRSSTAATSFLPSIKLNDGPPVNWSLVSSNLAPNMGDYQGMTANGCNVYADFADGRQGTPDSWLATINDCATATQIALVGSQALPDRVHLAWYSADGAGLAATVYRREDAGAWASVGRVNADGTGRIVFDDVAVTAGSHYGYRLGVADPSGEQFYGEVWIDVPNALSLALSGIRPNPAVRDLQVSFSLPSAAPAKLELIDVAGRTVQSVEVGSMGAGNHVTRLVSHQVRSGVYLVRLTQAGQSVTSKATFIQ